ncbi:alpha/beta fold hydrolase [Rhodocyclus purpureus]|uniref:alpha/beta fold hydrolase n=1 Tax=Rhodocyclus purpureus TaxID=1067 RepID=UPI001914CE98|nr:alpha/beta hydrolase [Rhodocyclus purpureus]MBK5913306.1 alpha/beta hydrolase [Rhodocyclus purpureus]
MQVSVKQSHFEVEDHGPRHAPAVLLIPGLGLQLTYWPDEFVQPLLDAGYRVIRFDNRDAGLSKAFDELRMPNFVWFMIRQQLGLPARPPYTLQDMADDARGILDALGIDAAHVVGISMGGMIAQRLAASAPQRVKSLTSMMSSSGAPRLPTASREVLKVMRRRPPKEHGKLLDHLTELQLLLASPAAPIAPAEIRRQLEQAIERSYRPVGFMRQVLAIASDLDRAELLARITAPTLVIHGRQDPMIPFACAEDTQRRIPGARLVGVEGMGHNLAPGICPQLADHVLKHLQACH